MLEFIKVAYCITIPLMLIFSVIGNDRNKTFFINLISVTNLLLVAYACFLIKQLYALYQMSNLFHFGEYQFSSADLSMMIRLILAVLLPFLSFRIKFRSNLFFTILLLAIYYSLFPAFSWNLYDPAFKILFYLSFFCTMYALLWLMNKLPNQSI